MKTLLTTTLFTLSPGEVTSLSIHVDQRLRVDEAAGTDVWVTREGDSEDYWLRCGGTLLLASRDEITLSVDPPSAGPVRLALIAEARRPATNVSPLVARMARRLVRGTESTPNQDQVAAS